MGVLSYSLAIFALFNFPNAISQCIFAPTECPNNDVKFYLYTNAIQNNPYQIIYQDDASVQNAPLLYNVPTIVSIHGYNGNYTEPPNPQLRNAYFAKGQHNIIAVDYGAYVKAPCYPAAAPNVRIGGKCTAAMLDVLIKKRSLPLSSIHVIGFSLGAHAAAELSTHLTSGRLERITGLDPAMALFVFPVLYKKLDREDANFVDIIHTSSLWFGKLEYTGHVDFFVNGGKEQPGCVNPIDWFRRRCSHERSIHYYAESVNSNIGFYGKRCDSLMMFYLGWCNFNQATEEKIMGYSTPITTRGIFFLNTNQQSPFAKGPWV